MTDIYFDENLPPAIAHAFSCLCETHYTEFSPKSTVDIFGSGTPDEDFIPKIGASGGILITKDTNMRKLPHQYELCSKYKLGMFFVLLPKNSNRYWDLVKLFIDRWEEITDIIKKKKPPFAYQLTPRGKLKELT